MNEETKLKALNWAKTRFPEEACGLVVVCKGKERFFPATNIHDEPKDCFAIDPNDYATAEDMGTITAIFHSHVYQEAEPSEADRVACEASGLPWHIVSLPTEVWGYCEPDGFVLPLIGRTHVWGLVDCWTIVRDWYRQEFSIELIDLPRDKAIFQRGEDVLGGNYKVAGFYDLDDEQPLERGDVLLMQTGDSTLANHVMLYEGDGIILHHAEHRLSSREVYGGWFQKHTIKRLRHENRPTEG